MAHFVNNVHNYILVGVLDSAWSVFLEGLKEVRDLDALILLQKKLVSDILEKAFLSLNESQKDIYPRL